MHIIRSGLSYNLELRWDGVRSLSRRLSIAPGAGGSHAGTTVVARRRPEDEKNSPNISLWRRLPTIDELNAIAPVRRFSFCICTIARC